MSYHVTIEGSVRLDPPAGENTRDAINSASRAWKISPNGALLYIPSDSQDATNDPFGELSSIVQELGTNFGIAVSGQTTWVGEDDVSGELRVENGEVYGPVAGASNPALPSAAKPASSAEVAVSPRRYTPWST